MTVDNFEPDGADNFGAPVEAATADAIFKSPEQLIRCSNVTECGSSSDVRRVVPKHLWSLEKQLVVTKNNKKLAKWTLKELSMQAATNTNITSPNHQHRVSNLPVVLLIDLEKMQTDKINDSPIFDHESRDDLLCVGQSSSSMENCRRSLVSLMHHRLTKIHLPSRLHWTEGNIVEFQMLLDEVGAKCSGLKLLQHKDLYYCDDPPDMKEKDFRLRTAFFRALPKLVSLQVVRLYFFVCDDWALQQFADHATNIVILEVALAPEVSSIGFNALSSLSHLQQFLFGDFKESWEFQQKCLLMSARFLPKLRFAGFNFADAYSMDMLIAMVDGDVGDFYHDQIVQQPFRLGLEELMINGNVQIHEDCQLPNLRALYTSQLNDGNIAGLFNRFTTITKLGICQTKTNTVMKVLQTVGWSLSRLALGQLPQKFSLLKLLQMCPKLERLHIVACTFDDFNSLWSLEMLSCLEETNFQMTSEPLPCGFIVKLLSAPLLKKVEMFQIYLTKGEVDQLLALVRQRCILHNIVRIEWENYYEDEEVVSWMADRQHFQLLLDTLQVTFPQINPMVL